MKSFMDILKDSYNFDDEINRIATLFNSPLLYTLNYLNHAKHFSIETVFEEELFSKWKGRLSCISISDLKNTLGIYHNSKNLPDIKNNNDIIKYLEYYVNILFTFVKSNVFRNYSKTNNYTLLYENIILLLERMNYKPIKDNEIFLLVPIDAGNTAAAEISSKHTGLAILQYHHRILKGDLKGKSKILSTIANEYEDILKNTPDGLKDLFDKTRGLCNQLCIRHTNAQNQSNVSKLTSEELEQWYDEIYQMLILCILISDNIKHKRVDKAKQLLDSFNKKA